MVFHWSLSDSKSPQVSRTRLRILAVLSNAVVWIVSTRPPTSKSPRPFNNPLVIVPNAPIAICTIVTFMFHSFFNSLARSRYLSYIFIIIIIIILLLHYYYYYYFTPFHTIVSRWSITGFWVTTNLLNSPGLFSVFWPILISCSLDGLYTSFYVQILQLLASYYFLHQR